MNVTARMMSTYCERGAIVPQRMAPVERAPLNIGMSIAMTTAIAPRTATTW